MCFFSFNNYLLEFQDFNCIAFDQNSLFTGALCVTGHPYDCIPTVEFMQTYLYQLIYLFSQEN